MSDLIRSLNSEAKSLWAELFNEPAPSHLEGSELIGLALSRMGTESYRSMLQPRRRGVEPSSTAKPHR
jgi:hypothetical protein